jgi:FxsC-like protein
MASLSPDTSPGFMDRELRPGNEWPRALAEALATCRVFVPLYSRRYFTSVHCSKEWSAFTRRVARQPRGTKRNRVIVPALWVPVPEPQRPELARYAPADFGETYADQGFYGIMKLSRYRHVYDAAVYGLARQIVTAGQDPLPPGPVEDYEQLEDAFDAASPAGDGERRVLMTVAAPDAASLDASNRPRGGSGARYGDTAEDWNPYPEDSARPLAEHAASLARSLGYLPEVGSLAEHASELVGQAPPTRAVVLIVDPWAVTVRETLEILQRIDTSDKPWITVVVAWNPKDPRMAGEEDRLRADLDAALPHKLVEGRVTSALARKGVPTLEDFSMIVPTVLRAAERSFLRSAPTFVAHDPTVK